LAGRALAIAESLAHPVYDCFYLALAEQADARLVTADTRLLNRLEGTAWRARGVSLSAIP
jgi:predicted nucleic acid-binding protein